jgi:hypothetical protein
MSPQPPVRDRLAAACRAVGLTPQSWQLDYLERWVGLQPRPGRRQLTTGDDVPAPSTYRCCCWYRHSATHNRFVFLIAPWCPAHGEDRVVR